MAAEIRGIVFDKDGTLFDYRGTWAVWCDRMLDDLSGGDAARKAHLAALCGYDATARDFVAGSVIVNGTSAEVIAVWAPHVAQSVDEIDALALRHVESLPNVPVCDLAALFGALHDRGVALGLATNDYEVAAHRQLREAGVDGLFDFVCGFDSGHGAKPAPGMIEAFCSAVDLPPRSVAMVGDSTHDLGAGRAAGVGLTVGVLTGPAVRADIAHLADLVLDDISHLPAALFA